MSKSSKEISLYPLIFEPILKDKIWGGEKLKTVLNKDCGDSTTCGESWELSDIEGDTSIIANGPLKGTTLKSLLSKVNVEVLGKKVSDVYGTEFPLLVKFIDANADLSIQVHPNDEIAKKRHNCLGKTEMWYLVDTDDNTHLISGFSKQSSKEEYLHHLNKGTLNTILNNQKVQKGDTFHIPAGRIHTIGKGCLIAEIQQTSDITYRIYDFDRKDKDGNLRELHTELALDSIDYNYHEEYKTPYTEVLNQNTPLVADRYFTTNKLSFNKTMSFDYSSLDSFVIYTCVEGDFTLSCDNFTLDLNMGQVVLIPSVINTITVSPRSKTASILETYIS